MEQDRLKILPLSRSARNAGASPEGFVIGEGFPHPQAEDPLPIALRRGDLRRHLYLCGKTGTGKSTLILRLVRSLMEAGEGLCLIDPHGDLVESVLPRVPEHRIEEVIFFNPEDRERPLGFNFLENDGSEEQQDFIVQEFISMVFKLFHRETMGPMFERGLRSALLLLMESDATLLDLGRVFSDEKFRRAGLEKMRDNPRNQEVRRYWEDELPGIKEKGELSLYVTSKLDRLLANATLRKIVGQKRSSFDIASAMAEGKILLVTLPKGVLGEMNAYMLGMILSSKIQMGALARAAIPPQQRRDFYLIVDEFHNLVSSAGGFSYAETERSFSSLLSEARKFGLSLILANQYIRQLDSGVREAVFGNTGSQIAFRVGAEDAAYLLQQFGPLGGDPGSGPGQALAEEDFTTCPDYHAYAHLLVGGREEPPFTLRTLAPERMAASAEIARAVIEGSRERYGRKPGGGDLLPVNGRRQKIIASLKQPINEVDLSVRAYTGLVAANIKTIGELVQKTENELRRESQALGRKSLSEIKELLESMDLHLGMELDEGILEELSERC